MGCDIHMYVEQRQVDGSWRFCPPPEIELYYYPETMKAPVMGRDWYWGRNYTLFGFLADVRNEMGWGTSRVRPIDTPRGIPADASEEYKRIAGPYTGADCVPCQTGEGDCPNDGEHGWGEDGHSHSWFTLRELVEAMEEERTVDHRGWVTPAQYAEFLANGSPSSWSGGVSGGGVEHISNDEMARLIVERPELTQSTDKGFFPRDPVTGKSYYTEIRWQNPLSDNLGDEWTSFIKRLQELTYDDGRDVRAVFFFDN